MNHYEHQASQIRSNVRGEESENFLDMFYLKFQRCCWSEQYFIKNIKSITTAIVTRGNFNMKQSPSKKIRDWFGV